MLDHLASRALVDGIINADSKTKGHLGQRCAAHLGLEPGPLGKDGGIDGVGLIHQEKIYFQSKLINRPLNAEFADTLYGNLVRHKANIALVLTGVGYTSGVLQRLKEFDDIEQFKIHLLTLHDYFNETATFKSALKDLPPLRDLSLEKCLVK
jgi:hypothetical protein